jgi:predicted acylesterase/phospholipase RssA
MPPTRHSSVQVSGMITINGAGDHDRPDWTITMAGMRRPTNLRCFFRNILHGRVDARTSHNWCVNDIWESEIFIGEAVTPEMPVGIVAGARKPVRRALVIQGGGAKGAFALGCMKAFQEHGIEFSAVSGTSAGGLCAIIWSTGRLKEGIDAWTEIDHSGFFGRSPDGCLRRMIKVLCIAGKLFVSYLRNLDPEGQPQFGRDIFFSVVVGIYAWLLLFNLFPIWLWLIAAVCIPFVSYSAFANELPRIGWDNRVRQAIVDVLVLVATTRLLVSATWMLLQGTGLVTTQIHITLSELLVAGVILAMMRLPVLVQTTLMEGKLLATVIGRFLESELKIPTFVAVAQEHPPNSRHFALPTPGVFKAQYVALDRAPADLKAKFAYASAALPFGIFAHAVIEGKIYVDGGVADNTPVLPIMMEPLDEVWIIRLQPGAFDVREHLRKIVFQTMFADGPVMPANSSAALDAWMKLVTIITLAPRISLGGLLTGTLNFSKRRTTACLRHGHRIATRAIRRGADDVEKPRIYRPRVRFLTRCRLLCRALPPCSMWRLFAQSDANRESLRDFHIPGGIRFVPSDDNATAWVSSVLMVWMLFINDALASEHPWRRAIGGTLIAMSVSSLPTWWARMKRNLGIGH